MIYITQDEEELIHEGAVRASTGELEDLRWWIKRRSKLKDPEDRYKSVRLEQSSARDAKKEGN